MWPEGVVLFFNTVQNKSGEWGVMSAHWYVSNALPKVRVRVQVAVRVKSGWGRSGVDRGMQSGV